MRPASRSQDLQVSIVTVDEPRPHSSAHLRLNPFASQRKRLGFRQSEDVLVAEGEPFGWRPLPNLLRKDRSCDEVAADPRNTLKRRDEDPKRVHIWMPCPVLRHESLRSRSSVKSCAACGCRIPLPS